MEDEFPSKEISTFASINALTRRMSQLPDDASDEEKKALYKKLWGIAYSYLLKKKPITESVPVVEDVPLELFAILVYEKSLHSEWTATEFGKLSSLMDSFEALSNCGKYNWLADVGKFLITLNHLRPKGDESPSANQTLAIVPSLGGVHDILPTFRLPEPPFSLHWMPDSSSTGHLTTTLVARLERMKVPVSPSVIEWGSRPVDPVKAGRSRLASTSTPHEDEGFSSPSAPAPRHHRPFDWSQFSIDHRELHRTWESYNMLGSGLTGESIDREYCPICRMRRIRKNIELSPFELNKLQHTDLMIHVKALLVGVSSDVFKKVDGEFVMRPGLYTEETPPNVMFTYFHMLKEAGTLFAQLQDLDGDYPCDSSASMKGCIKQFILDYHAVILSISDSESLLKVVLNVIPFIELLRYLAELLRAVVEPDDENALKGWVLIQKLYQDVLRSCHPNIFRLTSTLFLSCCQAYYKFINDWIFEGKWHPDLFFPRNSPVEPIQDRMTWKRMFSFSPKHAPTFLPSKCIFDCGMTVHLTRRRHHLENEGLERDAHPRVRLVTDSEELDLVRVSSKYYVQTGDALEVELLDIFKGDVDCDLLQAAMDKTAMDALKYDKSLAEAYALKVAERKRKVQLMKQELAEYEAHRNLQSLKDNIADLLEDDKIALAQLLQLISSASLRYELIDRFVQMQTRNVKRTQVNLWRERRYALNSKRTQYLDSLGLTKDRAAPVEFRTEVDASRRPFALEVPARSSVADGESVEKLVHQTPWQPTPIPRPTSSIATPEETGLAEPVESVTSRSSSRLTFDQSAGTQPSSGIPADDVSPSPLSSGESSQSNENVVPPHCCHPTAYISGPSHLDASPFQYSMKTTENTPSDEPKNQKTSALELRKSSLHYFTIKSLEYPLAAHNRVLNISVMHELFIEHDLLGHLKRLKRVLLRGDGVTAMSLTEKISKKVAAEVPANFLVYHKLNVILNEALPADADYIAPKVDSTPPAFEFCDPTIFRCVTFVYQTSWPLNLILTEPALSRYNDAFQLLFSLDRTLWYLLNAARSLVFNRMGMGSQLTEIQLQLHVMLVVVNALKFYSGSVVQQCWDKFYGGLKASKNHEEVYLLHAKYLKDVLRRFMLNKQARALHEVLWRVLKQVLLYCQKLQNIDWQRFGTEISYMESKLKKLIGYYTCFRNLVKATLRIIDKFVQERGYTHLIVLTHLLRLD